MCMQGYSGYEQRWTPIQSAALTCVPSNHVSATMPQLQLAQTIRSDSYQYLANISSQELYTWYSESLASSSHIDTEHQNGHWSQMIGVFANKASCK